MVNYVIRTIAFLKYWTWNDSCKQYQCKYVFEILLNIRLCFNFTSVVPILESFMFIRQKNRLEIFIKYINSNFYQIKIITLFYSYFYLLKLIVKYTKNTVNDISFSTIYIYIYICYSIGCGYRYSLSVGCIEPND